MSTTINKAHLHSLALCLKTQMLEMTRARAFHFITDGLVPSCRFSFFRCFRSGVRELIESTACGKPIELP